MPTLHKESATALSDTVYDVFKGIHFFLNKKFFIKEEP